MRTSFLDFEQAIAGFDGKIETLRFEHNDLLLVLAITRASAADRDLGAMWNNLRNILQEGAGWVNAWSIDRMLEKHFARLMVYGSFKEQAVC